MMRAILPLLLLLGCEGYDINDDARYLDLPEALREVSGLAVASENSVFAHDDESAAIHEISLDDGSVIRSFMLGNPTIEDDIEGIAARGNRLWIINSDGIIRAFGAGRDGARMRHQEYDTGLGDICEVEGLSLAPTADHLLIVCKNMYEGDRRGTLFIYEWNTETHEQVDDPWRQIGLGMALREERSDFAPSAIEYLPDFGQILVLSARGRSMLVMDEAGQILARHRLNVMSHPQAEGVTVVGATRLVIADEGQQGGPGQLAIYPWPLS